MRNHTGRIPREVTTTLEAALADVSAARSEGITLYPRAAPARVVHRGHAGQHPASLLLGAGLVAVCCFSSWAIFARAHLPGAMSLALLTAIIMLDRLGVTLNTITLGGLAIAIGSVVDDAIIDVENIVRRLRLNRACRPPRPVAAVILDASLEVRKAIVYATFHRGAGVSAGADADRLQGSFFSPLAKSYILAILASLVVALTVTPALTLIFFSRGARETERRSCRPCSRRITGGRFTGSPAILGRPRHGGRVLRAGAFAAAFPRGAFLPDFREAISCLPCPPRRHLLPEMRRIGRQISAELIKNPHIATVEQQIGRAEQGEDPWGPHRSEFHVELKPCRATRRKRSPVRSAQSSSGSRGSSSSDDLSRRPHR